MEKVQEYTMPVDMLASIYLADVVRLQEEKDKVEKIISDLEQEIERSLEKGESSRYLRAILNACLRQKAKLQAEVENISDHVHIITSREEMLTLG